MSAVQPEAQTLRAALRRIQLDAHVEDGLGHFHFPLGAALGLASRDKMDTTNKVTDAYSQGRQQMDDLTNGVELDQSDRDSVAHLSDYGSY